jgi:hypothetical protein
LTINNMKLKYESIAAFNLNVKYATHRMPLILKLVKKSGY